MTGVEFRTFDEALQAIQEASSEADIKHLVDQIDHQYEGGTLHLNPADWGRLASVVLMRGTDLKNQEQCPGSHCPAG